MSADTPASKVLVICHEPVGPYMAGPAIRYTEFARALAGTFDVTLASRRSPGAVDPEHGIDAAPSGEPITRLPFTPDDAADLRAAAEAADAVVAFGGLAREMPWLAGIDTPLLLDAYIPFQWETLATYATADAPLAEEAARLAHETLDAQFRAGDAFLCATERQRALWLGWLDALGRIDAPTYAADPSLRRLVDVVPFGLPAEPPAPIPWPDRPAAVTDSSRLVVWGGGLWQWLDPLTAIRAVALVAREVPEVVLYFPGAGAAPAADQQPAMPVQGAARQLADELGMTDRHVVFGGWVPYADRAAYLLAGEVGLSLHHPGVETDFAFRTRLLDYAWAGLPAVATAGDALGERVAATGAATLVPPGDERAVAEAVLGWLRAPDARARVEPALSTLRSELAWPAVIQPVRRFCAAPHRTRPAAPPETAEERLRRVEAHSEAQIAELQARAAGQLADWEAERAGLKRIQAEFEAMCARRGVLAVNKLYKLLGGRGGGTAGT